MFTKNFKNLMVLNLLNANNGGTSSGTNMTTTPTYYTIDGKELSNIGNSTKLYTGFTSALSDTLKTNDYSSNSAHLIIGTGTGTISENDYCLFNQYSDCTCTSASSTTTSNLTKSYTATFQNNSESDVTVTETGIVGKLYMENSWYKVLLEHTLLETPVIIPAGGTRTITYVWSF